MLQFSRRNVLQNTGIDPAIENRRIVWTFMFEAAGRKVACENSRPPSLPVRVAFHGCFRRLEGNYTEGSISYNYRFYIVTRFKS